MTRIRFSILLMSLTAMALLTFASAQVRLEPTAGAFPTNDDDFTDKPKKVGLDIRTDDRGLVIVLARSGAGSIPDIETGFAGKMPKTVLGDVDLYAAMNLCQSIGHRPGGYTFTHKGVRLSNLAGTYRTAFEEAGLRFVDQYRSGSSRTLVFATGSGDSLRLALTPRADSVEVYVGR